LLLMVDPASEDEMEQLPRLKNEVHGRPVAVVENGLASGLRWVNIVAQHRQSSRPLALAPGGGDLVPSALGDDLSFELGKRKKHIQDQLAFGVPIGGGDIGIDTLQFETCDFNVLWFSGSCCLGGVKIKTQGPTENLLLMDANCREPRFVDLGRQNIALWTIARLQPTFLDGVVVDAVSEAVGDLGGVGEGFGDYEALPWNRSRRTIDVGWDIDCR
jgi:hypothetical protein